MGPRGQNKVYSTVGFTGKTNQPNKPGSSQVVKITDIFHKYFQDL